jgi:hypothetical protein
MLAVADEAAAHALLDVLGDAVTGATPVNRPPPRRRRRARWRPGSAPATSTGRP